MTKAKPKSPEGIDPHSDAVVLEYRPGKATPGDVPQRDLHGGDLARIGYVRALRAAQDAYDTRRPQGDDAPLPEITRPGQPDQEALEALAAELIASGAYTAATPPEA